MIRQLPDHWRACGLVDHLYLHCVCKFLCDTSLKGGVVLARASAFLCLFMQLIITCCSRVRSAPFVTLAICKVFLNLTVFMSHTWCHGHCPVLVLPRGQGHFPMMDAGGSPFPHNDGASVDGGIMVTAGTTGSGTACATDPTGGCHIRPQLHGFSVGELS